MRSRIVIWFCVALLVVGGSCYTWRAANANPVFLPLIIGVLFSGVMGVGTAIEMYDDAPVPAAAVGATALSVTIVNPADSGAASGAVRIPTTASADSAAAVPAPSGAPATVTMTIMYQTSGNPPGPLAASEVLACSAYASSVGGSGTVTSPGNCHVSIPPSNEFDVGIANSGSCPVGYSSIGNGQCGLTNARAVILDGKQDLTRSGTTLAKIAGDDQGAVNAVLSTVYLSNDSADVSGISVSGQPRMVRTTALASGGSEVTQITQKTDGAGTTYLEKRSYTVDVAGKIAGASQAAVSGSLVANSGGTGYTQAGPGTSYTPAAPGSGTGVSGSGTGSTDYARQGEAAAAAATIVNSQRAADGSYPTNPVNGSSLQDSITGLCNGVACAESSGLNPGYSWFPSLFPSSAGACQPLEFRGAINTGPAAGLDSTTTLDVCWMLELVRDILGWIINVVAIIYIWRRFTNMYNGS
ncbi:MAG: hypothetical protein Q7T21_02850 [Gallionella sp.]|nr:hypothetical protein [Gallionella sp.]